MQIKLIALDLDGTLLNGKKQLSQRNRMALWKAHEAGVLVVPATGRLYAGIPSAIRELPFVRYAIIINGAGVYDIAEERQLYRADISCPMMERLFDYMDCLPVIYDCYQNGKGWMDQRHYTQLEEYLTNPYELQMVRKMRTPLEDFRRIMRERNMPVQKTQMYFRQQDLNLRDQEMKRMAELFPELSITASIRSNIEINDKNANKGRALTELCANLGIDPAQAMAFGDGSNDISMLRAAGVGVAMGNALEDVKQAANLVAPGNEEDGVAAVIERYVQ